MKKTLFYLLASLACVALIFSSCKDDKKNEPGEDDFLSPSEVEKLPYSSLTPEQQKEKLSKEANAFLSQIQDMSKEKSIEVFKAFGDLLTIDAPTIGGLELRSSDKIIKINQFYGKFTWQPSTQTWKEEPAQQLEFNFPVKTSEGMQQGKIVVTGKSSGKDYSYKEYYDGYWDYNTQKWIDEYRTVTVELPKEVSAKLYLGTSEVGGIQANADIVQSETAPRSSTVTFSFGSYKFTQSYNKSADKADFSANLKKGNTVLLDYSVALNGNIDKLIEEGDENYLSSGNYILFIMDNLAFTGEVDFANYIKEMNALDASCYPYPYPENFDWNKADENYIKGSAAIYNKYYNLYLVSTKDKTKIAKLTQKAKLETETYQWCDYWGDCETYTYTYWTLIPMLRFNDATEVEAEVYFSKGFDAVEKNFRRFIESFE